MPEDEGIVSWRMFELDPMQQTEHIESFWKVSLSCLNGKHEEGEIAFASAKVEFIAMLSALNNTSMTFQNVSFPGNDESG